MGFLESRGLQLASLDDVVPHVGLSTIRFESLGTSPDQRVVACRQRRPGLSVSSLHHRGDLAEPVGGDVVWVAPVARGIGGLGGGAQGRVEHLLRIVRIDLLRALRAIKN